VAEAGWAALRDELEADARRVPDRLRGLSQARLAAPTPPHESAAEAGHAAAQVLATAAQGLAERSVGGEPRWRQVPRLSDFAVGDQVAVTAHDLLAVLAGCDPGGPAWTPGARRTAEEVGTSAAATLAATRRQL
jgi:hypothetical protein